MMYGEFDDTASQNTVRAIDARILPRSESQLSNGSQLTVKASSSRSVSALKSESILHDAIIPTLMKVYRAQLLCKQKSCSLTLYMYSCKLVLEPTSHRQHLKHCDDHFKLQNESVPVQPRFCLKKSIAASRTVVNNKGLERKDSIPNSVEEVNKINMRHTQRSRLFMIRWYLPRVFSIHVS